VPADRLSVVLRAVAENGEDGAGSVVDRVCAAATMLLSVSGAGISLMLDGELRGAAGVSDPGIAAIQELELELGEGPGAEAWRSGAPVLTSDLAAGADTRWPVFAPAALRAAVRAVFAFPVALGAIRLGVLVLYRDRPGVLTADQTAYGLVSADIATWVILGLQAGAPTRDGLPELLAGEPTHWAEIHQATGKVAVQLEISLEEALVRLRAHAFATGRPLRAIARNIVAGELRLEAAT
jgi:hypothetical protein